MKRWIPIVAPAALLVAAVFLFAVASRSTGTAPTPVLPAGHPSSGGMRPAAARSGAASGLSTATGVGMPSAGPSKANVRHDVKARLTDLERQLDEAPGDTVAWAALARMQFDAHDMAGAAASYTRYLALHPANRQAWLDLATAQASRSAWDEAREATEDLLERYPDDPAGTYNMGAILANAGRTDEARTWWRRAAGSGDTDLARRAAESLARLDL